MSIPAIETIGLSKKYKKTFAIKDVNLTVPQGVVFAFLGANGTGKTTTIRILLDLLNRTGGEARILGMDCVKDALKIRKRVGYVSEGQQMYDWMTTDEIIWFCKQFRDTWDDQFTAHLKKSLDLEGSKKIASMSRGMKAKLALLLAMAFHPELLILDEPTAGMDVVVRRSFIEGVIELTQQEGRTVFFSSHLIDEVERVADWVGILQDGEMICCSSVEDLKASVKRLILTFDGIAPKTILLPGMLHQDGDGRQVAISVRDFSDATIEAANHLGAKAVTVEDMDLENIFCEMVGPGSFSHV